MKKDNTMIIEAISKIYVKILDQTVEKRITDLERGLLFETAIPKLYLLLDDRALNEQKGIDPDTPLIELYPETIQEWLESELAFIYKTYPHAKILTQEQKNEIFKGLSG